MPSGLGVFWREFLTNYHTTGAIAPSGRLLSKALARPVREDRRDATRRILEVGPGTGVVTRAILPLLRPDDRLTLVELNDRFVAFLRERFEREPQFAAAAGQTEIVHLPVQEMPDGAQFDYIISGLPLNNFSVELVERILAAFRRLLAPGGTLSFFEYMGMRPLKALVTLGRDRQRLRGLDRTLAQLFEHEVARDAVWPNLPPAWVHHVQFEPSATPENAAAGAALQSHG